MKGSGFSRALSEEIEKVLVVDKDQCIFKVTAVGAGEQSKKGGAPKKGETHKELTVKEFLNKGCLYRHVERLLLRQAHARRDGQVREG